MEEKVLFDVKLTEEDINTLIKKGSIGEFRILLHITGQIKKYFLTKEDEVFAIVPKISGDAQVNVESSSFEDWLISKFFNLTSTPVHSSSITSLVKVITAKIREETINKKSLALRVVDHNSKLIINLGNIDGGVIVMDEGKWEIENLSSDLIFMRNKSQESFPYPKVNGNLNLLRNYINLPDEKWYLLLGFILGCYHPKGPYPILIVQGTNGAGKSSFAKIMKKLIDPASEFIRSFPSTEKELFMAAISNHLLIYDNLSGLKKDMSDALCKLSTGAAYSTKTLYTTMDETTISATRPVIVNGIDYIAAREDLKDRAIILEIPKIKDVNRVDEETFWNSFNTDLPFILGGLFDVLAEIYHTYRSIKLPETPRMADFIKWVTAGEGKIGLNKFEFINIYKKHKVEAAIDSIEDDTLALGITKFLEHSNVLQGTASEIIKLVGDILRRDGFYLKEDWLPPNKFKELISRRKPALENIGITYEYIRGKERIHTFRRE